MAASKVVVAPAAVPRCKKARGSIRGGADRPALFLFRARRRYGWWGTPPAVRKNRLALQNQPGGGPGVQIRTSEGAKRAVRALEDNLPGRAGLRSGPSKDRRRSGRAAAWRRVRSPSKRGNVSPVAIGSS